MCTVCSKSGIVGFIKPEEHAVENVTCFVVSECN